MTNEDVNNIYRLAKHSLIFGILGNDLSVRMIDVDAVCKEINKIDHDALIDINFSGDASRHVLNGAFILSHEDMNDHVTVNKNIRFIFKNSTYEEGNDDIDSLISMGYVWVAPINDHDVAIVVGKNNVEKRFSDIIAYTQMRLTHE